MSEIDPSFTERALAPDSPLAHVYIYVPDSHRAGYRAVLALDEQVTRATNSNDPEPRYAKLAWWREEFLRLEAGSPVHPVTRALAESTNVTETAKLLNELLGAAMRETEPVRFSDLDEMLAHAMSRQGSVQKLQALALTGGAPLEAATAAKAGVLGQAWWLTHAILGSATADVALVIEREQVADRADALYKETAAGLRTTEQPLRRVFAVHTTIGQLMLETSKKNEPGMNPPRVPAIRAAWRAWRAARRAR